MRFCNIQSNCDGSVTSLDSCFRSEYPLITGSQQIFGKVVCRVCCECLIRKWLPKIIINRKWVSKLIAFIMNMRICVKRCDWERKYGGHNIAKNHGEDFFGSDYMVECFPIGYAVFVDWIQNPYKWSSVEFLVCTEYFMVSRFISITVVAAKDINTSIAILLCLK